MFLTLHERHKEKAQGKEEMLIMPHNPHNQTGGGGKED